MGASVTLDQEPVVLGRTESVGMTIHIDEQPGTESRPLRLSVNVGSFGEIQRLGAGSYHTVYHPPPTRFPQVALIAAWRETGPEAQIDFLRVPLFGATQIPVAGRPGSQVKVVIGAQEFGPLAIRHGGKTVVPVIFPPGVPEAIINVKAASGVVTQKRAKVDVPAYNRLTVAIVPHALLANGKDHSRIEVFYDLSGDTLAPDRIKLDADLGQAVFERSERGRYVFRYLPPAGATTRTVEFNASVIGDPLSRASLELELGLPPAATLVVTPPPKPIVADGHSQSKVTVLVFDATGLGLPQQDIELTANGQAVSGLTYVGNGVYEASFVAPVAYPPAGLVQFQGRVRREGSTLSGTANYEVLPPAVPTSVALEFKPNPVVANGTTKSQVTLEVRDVGGFPLNGAQIFLAPDKGSMSPLVELGEGRYRSEYVVPADAAPGEATVKVVDASGKFEKKLAVALRAGPSLLIGVRGGYTHSFTSISGLRGGVDAWVPFRIGGVTLGAGLSVTYGQAQQTVEDSGGTFSSRSSAIILPMVARLGYELYATERLAFHVGAGPQVTWVEVSTSAAQNRARSVGVGGLGFVSGSFTLGPGQLLAEVSYAVAPVTHADFRLNAGGLAFEAGYRLGLF